MIDTELEPAPVTRSRKTATWYQWTNTLTDTLTATLQEQHFASIESALAPPFTLSTQQDADTVESKDVLIVEDELYLCDLVADVLEAEGHHARKAANGLDALAKIAEAEPQLILLDLMMPVMDGWEFMAALRDNPDWAHIPVVIITAVYDVARTQRDTGAKAIITKPFDIDQLVDAVKTYAS